MTYKNGSNSGHQAAEMKIFNKLFQELKDHFWNHSPLNCKSPITQNWPHWGHGTIQNRNFSCTIQASYMPQLIPNKKINERFTHNYPGFFHDFEPKKGGHNGNNNQHHGSGPHRRTSRLLTKYREQGTLWLAILNFLDFQTVLGHFQRDTQFCPTCSRFSLDSKIPINFRR